MLLKGAGLDILWRPVLARWASGVPLALACAMTGIATLLPWVVPGVLGFALSALFRMDVIASDLPHRQSTETGTPVPNDLTPNTRGCDVVRRSPAGARIISSAQTA